jgi:hypothetical protein
LSPFPAAVVFVRLHAELPRVHHGLFTLSFRDLLQLIAVTTSKVAIATAGQAESGARTKHCTGLEVVMRSDPSTASASHSARHHVLRRVLASLLVMISIAGCRDGESERRSNFAVTDLLSQPLWTERDAYDASHHLMVPMHAAFAQSKGEEIEKYARFFSNFRTNGTANWAPDPFHRMQFLWFYSRFISLLADRENCSQRAIDHHATARSLWLEVAMAPHFQWDRPDFPTLFDRVRWKVEQTEVAKSYYRAITDGDLHGLAVGADLAGVAFRCALDQVPQYAESRALARAIFSNEVTQTSVGGWVLQPGAWTDHPDFEYAGNDHLAPDLQPVPVPGISPDSSHSFRLPLWLVSFACAEESGSQFRELFVRLNETLAIQWRFRTVAMPDSSFAGVRMTNYMDGENGVYRYGYPTQGPGRGFGPYELSGSLNIGWWSFVGPVAKHVYEAQLESLPFGDKELAIYLGPNTTRARNPAMTEPDFYTGILIREILDSAVVVASRTNWCR